MTDVKWIKLIVGMFDGKSMRKIKRAEIAGERFRDKLTAVWFELLDLAGKCNSSGEFRDEKGNPYNEEDISAMLDRTDREIMACITYYLSDGMIAQENNCYSIANWEVYQNVDELEKIRENNRLRQAKFKENKRITDTNVTVTLPLTLPSQENKSKNKSEIIKESNIDVTKEKATRFIPPTIEEVKDYCKERSNSVDSQRFIDFYRSKGWYIGKNKMKDWKASIRTWEQEDKSKVKGNYSKREYTDEQLQGAVIDFKEEI